MIKLLLFKVPIFFTYNYKSIFYNKKNKKFLNLQTNVFRYSISRFSHKLTADQPMKLSTLKIIKKKKSLINFLLKLISTPFWVSFTLTDLHVYSKINLNQLMKKLNNNYKDSLTSILVNKSYFSFLEDDKFIIESLLNLKSGISIEHEKIEKFQEIYSLKYLTTIKYFLLKYFFPYIGFYKNNMHLTKNNFSKFFYEKRIFLFFHNNIWNEIKFYIFRELVKTLNLSNSIIFLNGKFFFLQDFFKLKINFSNYLIRKNIEKSLIKIFEKIFCSTNFLILQKSFVNMYKTNLYSLLLSKYYFFNHYSIFYFKICLLIYKIKNTINFCYIILQKQLNNLICQLLIN